jgi:hypothetical protein
MQRKLEYTTPQEEPLVQPRRISAIEERNAISIRLMMKQARDLRIPLSGATSTNTHFKINRNNSVIKYITKKTPIYLATSLERKIAGGLLMKLIHKAPTTRRKSAYHSITPRGVSPFSSISK